MKKIIIAGSGSLREKWLERKTWRESKWYEVLNYPKKIQSNNLEDISQEYKDLYIGFFKDLQVADVLFLMNEDKKSIQWYIGAESFAELSFANVNNVLWNKQTKIFIMQMPSGEVWCHEEIDFFLKLGWIEILDKKLF
jgi:hypothetical protein